MAMPLGDIVRQHSSISECIRFAKVYDECATCDLSIKSHPKLLELHTEHTLEHVHSQAGRSHSLRDVKKYRTKRHVFCFCRRPRDRKPRINTFFSTVQSSCHTENAFCLFAILNTEPRVISCNAPQFDIYNFVAAFVKAARYV